MRVWRMVALGAIVVAQAVSMGVSGAEPSDGCAIGGMLPAEISGPTGLQASQIGDPTTGPSRARACNRGAVVPAPAKGSVTVQVNGSEGSGFVDVDGDSDNSATPCTDGYVRVVVNSAGPSFYQRPDGAYSTTHAAQSPDAWAQSIASNCAGPLPAP